MMSPKGLSWLSILRLGLVQSAIGAIVVLMTSTLNRVAVVEFGLAAMVPAGLVGWHYAVQLSRPHWGLRADQGGARTPWIIGGMAMLAIGGAIASFATIWMASAFWPGLALGLLAFTLIGAGVGAAGTNLLALLASRAAPARRPAAAALTWVMMILGIVLTAALSAQFLAPFSPDRLLRVALIVCASAFALASLAVWGVERASRDLSTPADPSQAPAPTRQSFRAAFAEIWAEPMARRFTLFVFASMLAYSAQDLILEPFAGLVFGLSPAQSTALAGMQHGGVLLGMILVGALGGWVGAKRQGWMRSWTIAGCVGSALALGGLAIGAARPTLWPLEVNVFALGFANGMFAVAAIGSMMGLAGHGRARREGARIGLWGAAQAIAFGLGGFLGAAGVDALRRALSADPPAFASVFTFEAALFLFAAFLAARIDAAQAIGAPASSSPRLQPAE